MEVSEGPRPGACHRHRGHTPPGQQPASPVTESPAETARQQANNANLGAGNCHSQSDDSPGEADPGEREVSNSPQSHQQVNHTNLGAGNCHSQSDDSPGEADPGEREVSNSPQSHQQVNHTNLGAGNCHSQSDNSPGEADPGEREVSNSPHSHQQVNHTNLGAGNCHSQSDDSPGEADPGEREVSNSPQSHQQVNHTNLGAGNCHSQSDDSPGEADLGEREVSNSPQSHQQVNHTNLGAGNCQSPTSDSPGGMEVSNSPHSHQQVNHTNLGAGNCQSQTSDSPGGMEVSNSPQSHQQVNHTNLGAGNCQSQTSDGPGESQSDNRPGEADQGQMGVGHSPQSYQQENHLHLGVDNCLSPGGNSPGEADQGETGVSNSPQSHQQGNHLHLGVGNCLSPGDSPEEADQGEREVSNSPQSHQQVNHTNLGVDNCLSQGDNSPGGMEASNTPLRGGQTHQIENNTPGEQQENHTNLGVNDCHSQGSNSPGEADQGEREVSNSPQSHQQVNNANLVSESPGEGVHQQVNNANLGAGNCHSQSSNSPGGMEVSNTPLRGGQTHQMENNTPGEQQENHTNLGVGNCHSQGDNSPGEADQGEREVGHSPQSHQQESNANLGVGNCHTLNNNTLGDQQKNHTNLGVDNCYSQSNNSPGEDEGYSPGSGDHPCWREMEIDETQIGITVNNRSGGVIVVEGEIVHVQNGKSVRGGTGDCLLENEETKGNPGEEQMQERAFVSGAERESCTEIGRKELAPEDGECVAGNSVFTPELERLSKGETQQETGKNSDGAKDVPAEKAPERGKEEEISPELQVPGVNCAAKECPMEENCLETETLEEKGRRPKMSVVQTRDKFTQYVSTEASLQEVKIEAMQKEANASGGESSNEGNCRSLQLTVVQQEDKNSSGQTIEERDVKEGKNSKTVLDGESAAALLLDKECRGTESDSEGPLHTAASTDRLQMPNSPCDSCSEHSASPRIRLDLLSPLGEDTDHPLALTPSTPEQADDSTSFPADGRARHGVKRVTFPSDEAIVSGAVEPKDPWRHAQNVTVEEIIAAYKMACQKLNCKPINKLLKQIQEFKELSQRLDCLDLKGEKLDYKASEALEEVFKRVQFKLVDLEATNLDEDGASALFDMIEYYESATQLNISFNKHIGTRGWQAAAHMMRKTSCLQYLDARNTPLLDHSAPFVARALRISSSLVVLHLENASLSGRPLMLLATALKMNMMLRELFLADNKLNGLQDSAQLGNLLKFNCTIQLMDLRNNHILDSGLAYISDGLKEQRQGLVTLVLWNNQLTHNGMTYMAAALPYTLSLETLNLGHNTVGNEGVHKLKDGLIANRSVLRLGLASTKLTCEGAVAVAEFIADSPRLLRLDLRENEIKTGGLMALSLALKVNHSLLRLDLDREPKKETVKSFIETQKALLAEIQNGCKRNFILAKEKEQKEHKLQQSASMPEITVTLCDNTQQPQRSQVCPKTKEAPEGSGNGVAQESVPSVTGNTEELGSTGESGVTLSSVECNAQPAAQAESVRRAPQPSEVGVPNSEKQQLQHQDPSETPSGKESVTDCDTGDGSSPASAGEQGSQIATELKSTGSESPVFVSSPIEIPPRNNERLVSSPGRGHKIFVVTRVESPPEVPNGRDMQWLKESSSEPSPCSASDTRATLTVPASASDGSLQSGSPSDPDRWADTGHDFETVCAKDCDHVGRGTALPNGLKAELVHRLPESTLLTTGRDDRAVSCGIEHEFTSPKTEKELEELLLEASQETCRETS